METSSDIVWQRLQPLVKKFLQDIKAGRAVHELTQKASLERDLGIGSLERAELFHRIEKEFVIQLSDRLMAEVATMDDLIQAIKQAKPPQQLAPRMIVEGLQGTSINPSQANTLVHVLQIYADQEPERPHVYLQDEYGDEVIISYGELFREANKVAQGIIAQGLKAQETVAIMLPTSKEFFFAFMGVLLVGGIPVPIYPPFRPDRIEEYVKREAFILKNAGVRLLITFQKAERLGKILKTFIPSLIAVTTTAELQQWKAELSDIEIEPDDAALIQYTSGSTGDPKGVLLTHQNLLANIRAYGEAIDIKPTDVVVSWLPLYHDMGLIGTWLGSLYYGLSLTLLSPLTFLRRPERWLWAIHYHRATLSAGPNFAYELCLKKIDPSAIEGLDLSSWRLSFNGAEAISPKTLRHFAARFGKYGLKSDAIFPVYGLAESSVALTFPPLGREPRIDRVERDVFDREQRAIPVKNDGGAYHEFVACGVALPGHQVRIVDENNNELQERVIGQIQFTGPSSMQGYYRRQEATSAIYHDGWWDTGDLGYMADGELFITGRKKDLIIKAGRNYYPEEIEETVSLASDVRKGCVVAFGAYDSRAGTEKIIVVAELRPKCRKSKHEIRAEIVGNVASHIGVPPDQVVLVPAKTIPKTSSGKLRRSSVKESYAKDKMGQPYLPVWLQLSKLWFASLMKHGVRVIQNIGKSIYGLYACLVILLTVPITWLAVMLTPRQVARRITNCWARGFLCLMACPC